ncbi:MAG TPA: hypothetical protein VLT59_03165 [Steroidobacteraceae bacterium]|nr:hypothetical protein [Steroidobacteraceae bacterium]
MRQNHTLGGALGAAALGLVMATAANAQQYQQEQQYQQDRQQQMQRMHQQMPQAQQKQMHDQRMGVKSASTIVVGEVVESRDVNIAEPAKATHRLIKIRSQNGRTAIVDIGNADEYARLGFKRGDRIIAVGKQGRINDEPVIFAKSVGELQSVGRHITQQGQMTSASRSDERNRQGQQMDRGATIYYFTTDNLATDDYGYYDEDFAWETNDQWYSDWNDFDGDYDYDTGYETGNYGLFGYDDAGEWGLWDW